MKKYHLLASVLLICFLTTATVSGGIFSGLAKLGRAAKKVDDVPTSVVRHVDNIPQKLDGLNVSELKPNSSGSWDIKLADGQFYDVNTLIANGTDLSEHALVLRSFDVPSDISRLDAIPNELPVYIRNRNGRSLAYIRGDTPRLEYKNLNIPLQNGLSIKTALYHLDKPLSSRRARFIQLTDKAGSALPVTAYGSRVGVETVSANQLANSLKTFNGDDLILSGPIKDGKIFPQGLKGDGVSLSQLKSIAAENDLNLLLLDSKKPKSVLNHLQKTDNGFGDNPSSMPLNTGDLFAAFTDSKKVRSSNSNPFEVSFSQSGRSQVTIQTPKFDDVGERYLSNGLTQSVDTVNKSVDIEFFNLMVLRSLLRSAMIYQRSQERDAELAPLFESKEREYNDPGFYGYSMLYLVVSFFAGLLVFASVKDFWNWLFEQKPSESYSNKFFYWLVKGFRAYLLLFIFLPAVGLPVFIYKVFRFLITPFIWLGKKFV